MDLPHFSSPHSSLLPSVTRLLHISIAIRVRILRLAHQCGSSIPRDVPESEQRPQLDQRVIVSEQDISGQEPYILWVPPEVWSRLDELRAKNPDTETGHPTPEILSLVHRVAHSEDQSVYQRRIIEQREINECAEVDCINAPWLRVPHGLVDDEALEVASPGGA